MYRVNMLRIAVTGHGGQIARSLLERSLDHTVAVIAVGRPELDLGHPETIIPALRRVAPDIVVNAAAYTDVDQAEQEPDFAHRINSRGAGAIAAAAGELNVPVVHLSTDYVFDGLLNRPYRESDLASPVGAYGHSKLSGERAVAAAHFDHAILRTAWLYSPFGKSFVKTMLRLAEARKEIAVVADQQGSPTYALDLADGIIAVCRNLLRHPGDSSLRGVFHITGTGTATWADLAAAVFEASNDLGGPTATVRAITTADYPTQVIRPANSRLDGAKLGAKHGVYLPRWESSVRDCVERIISEN